MILRKSCHVCVAYYGLIISLICAICAGRKEHLPLFRLGMAVCCHLSSAQFAAQTPWGEGKPRAARAARERCFVAWRSDVKTELLLDSSKMSKRFNTIQNVLVFGKHPARASRSVVVFSCLRHFRIFSKHPFHSTFYSVFLCAVEFSALFAVFRDALAVIVACWHARVCSGGWGGVGGGLITFLFINVPASSFLTRFSLLQVTVWHTVDVSVLICWRWCPVACGHGVGFGGVRTFMLTSVLATTSLHAFLLCNSYHHHLQHHHHYQHNHHH